MRSTASGRSAARADFPDEAIEPMQRLGMVYFAIVGGAAALETTQIEEIEEVDWEESCPSASGSSASRTSAAHCRHRPHGNSLFHDVQARAQDKLKELYARL